MGYIGMCRCEGYGFSSSLLQDRVYKSERLGLEQGIIFQETDQLVEDSIQTRDCGIRFCFGQTVLVTSVVSRKQLLQNRGDLWSLLSVQSSKIQLNQHWYSLRVLGSQRHIPTQKFLKYSPPLHGTTACLKQSTVGICIHMSSS